MSITKLFLSVSVIAMFAVGSAWATTPGDGADIMESHGVWGNDYDDENATGIASVAYVNRAVNAAGVAAQNAEDHAAAAGRLAYNVEVALEGKLDNTGNLPSTLYSTNEEGTFMPAVLYGLRTDQDGALYVNVDNETLKISADNKVYAETADEDKPGVVKQGENITITDGKVNVATATATTAGVMNWGQVPAGSPTSTTSAQIWIE